MSIAQSAPLVALCLVAALDLWIYTDAQTRTQRGSPVTFRAGDFVLETPAAWAVACLLLFVLFVPIYLVSRNT